jgi:glycosyltransferase involved in cell wall biosynthesis
MQVLFLSAWFPYPPDNGSKIRVHYLLRALAQSHQVTLLSFAFDTAQPEAAEELGRICANIQTVQVELFGRNRRGDLKRFVSSRPVITRPVPAMSGLLQNALAEKAFQAVIASTQAMSTYALQMPSSTARILEEHNSLTRLMWERYQGQTSALQRLRCWASWQKARRFEARLFPQFDLVTMVSAQDCAISQILPGHGGRVEVVPNGVDCQQKRPGLVPQVPNTLVFNGALTYSANYDAMQYFLANVYPLVRQQEPDVSLTITGSTSGVDLSGLRLDDSVHLSGYVEDVRPLVAGAWACVVPIRYGGGTRLKILEAMALGTPVIATSKGAEGLDVSSGREILIADEPAPFAAKTVALLSDADLRQRLTHNARLLVEDRYDWRAIGQRFNHLVESVVRGESGR